MTTTTFEENGKQYKIEDGRVVEASTAAENQEESVELVTGDRVVVGKKLGTIKGMIQSVYGMTAAVQCDDGSLSELLLEDLKPAPFDKTASVATVDDFETEYNDYVDMPTDTTEEYEIKEAKARELNLRAKALQTNSKNTLADQILYDRVITATAVDVIDLREGAQFSHAAEENYLERLPKYNVPDVIREGGSSRGDASWLANVADDFEVEDLSDGILVDRATKMVSSFSREDVESDQFMQKALVYSFANLPEDKEVRQKFAKFAAEARNQRLEESSEMVKTASADSITDLDGNEFSLEDLPIEAIFGV